MMTFKEWLETTMVDTVGKDRITAAVNRVLPLMGPVAQKAWNTGNVQGDFWATMGAKQFKASDPEVKTLLTQLTQKTTSTLQPKNQVNPTGQLTSN